jgi:hypothetical protein
MQIYTAQHSGNLLTIIVMNIAGLGRYLVLSKAGVGKLFRHVIYC